MRFGLIPFKLVFFFYSLGKKVLEKEFNKSTFDKKSRPEGLNSTRNRLEFEKTSNRLIFIGRYGVIPMTHHRWLIPMTHPLHLQNENDPLLDSADTLHWRMYHLDHLVYQLICFPSGIFAPEPVGPRTSWWSGAVCRSLFSIVPKSSFTYLSRYSLYR